MDVLQSRVMSLDRAGDGKCTFARFPARRLPATFCSGSAGDVATYEAPDSRCEDISRGDTGKAAEEDASRPSTAKVAPGW
jgi:hypothetical protein